MNNRLGLTYTLTLLLLAICFAGRALDAHAEWEQIPGTEVIGSVGLLESDGLRLYAAGDTGFYLSFDDGYTWRRSEIGRGIEDFYITTIGSGRGAVYVGTIYHGIFRSDDGGNTWKQVNEGLKILHDPKRGPHHGIVHQLLVTSSGMVINVGYHDGTHISHDRGETWHDVTLEWKYHPRPEFSEWYIGAGIWSMTEYGGYLWIAHSVTDMFRSSDDGETWELIRRFMPGRVTDWAVLGDRLYVSGQEGFGRWNEMEGEWEYLTEGLPFGRDPPHLMNLAVNRGRIFAALGRTDRSVWLYDQPSETWVPVGPPDVDVHPLVSHQSDLFAGTEDGIYRASIPVVQPYGKAITTWGALKTR